MLQSGGLQRVGHGLVTEQPTHTPFEIRKSILRTSRSQSNNNYSYPVTEEKGKECEKECAYIYMCITILSPCLFNLYA